MNKIDYYIAKFFHLINTWGGNAVNHLMKCISFIADAGILFLLIGLGLALFKRTRKVGGTILLAVAIGFLITNILLKNIIARARPFENVNSDYFKWWIDAGAISVGEYSFPSGHTTATTAFAVAIFLTTPKKYSKWILLLPIAMACSRIYLMIHYFTDCLGGMLVGFIGATLAYLIIGLVYKSKIKLFVWAKNFDVFKFKSTTTIATRNNQSTIKSNVDALDVENQSILNQEINTNESVNNKIDKQK